MAAIPLMIPALTTDDGTPLSGALISFKKKGTSTNQVAYLDEGLTTPCQNPEPCDAGGRQVVYLNGALSYDVTVKDAAGAVTYLSVTYTANANSVAIGTGWAGVLGDTPAAKVGLIVASYAALTALTTDTGLVDNGVYHVLGRTSERDGGEGTFVYDAASVVAANTGTTLAIDGGGAGRFFRLYDGITLDARWFGFLATSWGGAAQSAGVQTANVAAITAAVAAMTKGQTLALPPGDAYLDANIWVCKQDATGFIGAGDNATRLFFTSATANAVRIGGNGTFVNEPRIANLSIFRSLTPTSDSSAVTAVGFVGTSTLATTTTTPPLLSASFAAGLIVAWTANAQIANVRTYNHFVDRYFINNTGAVDRESVVVRDAGNGSTFWYSYYFDGRGTATSGTSMNGSTRVEAPKIKATDYAGTSFGPARDGRQSTAATNGDIRDIWLVEPETAGLTYAEFTVSSNAFDTDICTIAPKHDNVKSIGIFAYNLSEEASYQVTSGWLNGGTGADQLLYVQNCRNGFHYHGKMDGGAGYATAVAAYFLNSRNCSVGGDVSNAAFSYVVDGSVSCTIKESWHGNVAGHNGTTRVLVTSDCTDTSIELQHLDGEATTGVEIESGALRTRLVDPMVTGTYTTAIDNDALHDTTIVDFAPVEFGEFASAVRITTGDFASYTAIGTSHNIGGMWNASTGVATAPRRGVYEFYSKGISNSSGEGRAAFVLEKNSATFVEACETYGPYQDVSGGPRIMLMALGDTANMNLGFIEGAVSGGGDVQAAFSGRLVRPY